MVHIKFATQQKIKKHVDTAHEGIKSFKCSVCDPYELLSGYFMQKHTKKSIKRSKAILCMHKLSTYVSINSNKPG